MGYFSSKKCAMLMSEPPVNPSHDKPKGCRGCMYFQPTWKYRMCTLTECQYGLRKSVFRKKPLIIHRCHRGDKYGF